MAVAPPSDRVAGLPAPRVREDADRAAVLTARADPGGRAASVTDLVEPRRAYWRIERGPAPPTPERRDRMTAGRAAHRAVDRLLPEEGAFEVRVRRRGVSARIDLLAEVPVEIKSGAEAPPDDLVEGRPEYIEQLALYCALLDRPHGRVVHLRWSADAPPEVRARDISFGEPAVLRAELDGRASALRSALATHDPSGLPRCRWFGRGCEFRSAGICSCAGAEPPPSGVLTDQVVGVVVRGDIEERWSGALAGSAASAADVGVARYRDLVYPRRAYFDARDADRERPGTGPAAGPVFPSETYDRAVGAIEAGPIGSVRRLPDRGASPDEEVTGWDGEPYIVRTSRAWARVPAQDALDRFPQYALELSFRCAATGTHRGRAVIAYERASVPAERLQVLEFDFGDGLPAYAAVYGERLESLTRAVKASDPGPLPACPLWMTADCAYRDVCGCPAAAGRSQR